MSRSGNMIIWDYYTKNQEFKIAECNVCKKNISYKTTITNLKQHLKLKHISVFNELTSRSFTHHSIRPVAASSERSSSESGQEGDFNHIASTQQKLAEGFHDSDDQDVEENTKKCFTEVVYLFDGDDVKDIQEVITKTKSPVPLKKIKIQQQPVPRARADNEEEIEIFGRYIIGLLKTVPNEVCTKLQMDIVNLIMTAKLNAQTAQSNAYMTSVNMAENGTPNHSLIINHPQIPNQTISIPINPGYQKQAVTIPNSSTTNATITLTDSIIQPGVMEMRVDDNLNSEVKN